MLLKYIIILPKVQYFVDIPHFIGLATGLGWPEDLCIYSAIALASCINNMSNFVLLLNLLPFVIYGFFIVPEYF